MGTYALLLVRPIRLLRIISGIDTSHIVSLSSRKYTRIYAFYQQISPFQDSVAACMGFVVLTPTCSRYWGVLLRIDGNNAVCSHEPSVASFETRFSKDPILGLVIESDMRLVI